MKDSLKKYYEEEGLEELRLSEESVQYTEFLTLTKYLDLVLPKNSKVLDPCAGTGAYSFYLAENGHKVTAGDLFEVNINKLKNDEKSSLLEKIFIGDIRNLSEFEDESFDCVLCMGALYHLEDEAERKKSVIESMKKLKTGGILVATYINRYAAILGNCRGEIEDIDEVLEFLSKGVEGVFYTHTPAEIDEFMSNFPLEKLYHIGADGIGYLLLGETPIITFKGLQQWRKIHFETCEVRELLGYSYHGAYFGKKTK